MTGKTSKEVVTDIVSSDKHAFVEASAGTGKTTLLVELVTKIIENNKATIGEILCVTFTEKAASELKDRISQALRRSQNPLCQKASEAFSSNQIGTIHSFCLNALREHPLFRLSADTILPHGDEDLFEEARERVYRIDWSKLPKEQLAKFLAACEFGKKQYKDNLFDSQLRQKALWCFARNELPLDPIARSLEEVHDALTFQSWTIFRIVKTMQELACERNLLTYSLMVTRLAQLVEDEGFAEKLRCRYRYALVDEFQDTDPVQWKIFRTLFCQKGKTRLIVVGDPKQAIYKFRGADVFVYLKARDELKALNAYEGKLEKNFRNNQALLEFHNLLFENPKIIEYWQKAGIQYHKPYLARKDGKTQHADEAAVEIFYVKEKFTNALLPLYAHNAVARIVAFRKKRPTARCAVIALRHQSLRVFANALRAFGLEYSYYNEKPDFMRPEFLHLKVLLRSLLLPVGEGFAQAQATLFLKERSNKTDWYYRLHQFAHTGHLTELVAELAQDTTPLMLRLACGGDCADYFAWQNLLQVLLAATGQGIHDLPSLLEHIDYLEQNPNEELGTSILREDDAVTLITLHSAKGLDWDLVVVADGHNEPGFRNFAFFHDDDKNAVVPMDLDAWEKECTKIKPEEEARLVQLNYFYVALTRARDKLILLHCRHNSNSEPSGTMAFFLSKVPFLSEWDPGELPPGVRLLSLEKNMNVQQETPATKIQKPLSPINHSNVSERIVRRTSFSDLVVQEFPELERGESPETGVLPRGKETGNMLHRLLEDCNFSLLYKKDEEYCKVLAAQIRTGIQELGIAQENIDKAVEKVQEILFNTAGAALPLANGRHISLGELSPEWLLREASFWGSKRIHRVLSGGSGAELNTMRGFMDLVFTADEQDFYLLDYKSNTLTDINPENIASYVQEHYAVQGQIYCEALAAYLKQHYPQAKVRGIFFVFLRHLQSGKSQGIHFIPFGDSNG